MVQRTMRPTILARHGVVCSGHHLASLAGIDMLMQGGNAVDAILAASAASCVVLPNMCGVGGDGFVLLYDAKHGAVKALNASGPAPRLATRDFFLQKGHKFVPEKGLPSASVPGLVDAWLQLHRLYGSFSLDRVFSTAIRLADEGFPVYPTLAKAILESGHKLEDNHSARVFFRNGRPLAVGELLVQKELAKTLGAIASQGRKFFYEGEFARALDKHSKAKGGLLRGEDLADYSCEWKEPLSSTYHSYVVYEQPPVSQGFILLEELNIAEEYQLSKLVHNSTQEIHLMAEAKKLAFEDRNKHLSDPGFVKVPVEELLSKKHAAELRERIDPARAIEHFYGPEHAMAGETTYLCTADGHGNAVSLIQSVFASFGCGEMVEGTGVILNDRMYGFSLNENHVNRLEPGKKTAHTLNSYMVFEEDGPLMVGGSPGADDQVQVNFQVIVNILDHGLDLQKAVEEPRWSSRPGTLPAQLGNPLELYLERSIGSDVAEGLKGKGHRVKLVDDFLFGSTKVIKFRGVGGSKLYEAAADPRREAYAIGF